MILKAAIIAGYLAAVTLVGFLARRRSRPGQEDFFLAGRSLGPVLLLLTLAATNFSAFTVFGFAGAGYRIGYAYFPIMAFGTGFMALTFLFVGIPIWRAGRRLGAVSPPELIWHRFRNKPLRIAYLSVMVLFTVPYLAIQPMGAGYALNGLLGIPYELGAVLVTVVVVGYVLLGGFRGVVWTDALQGVLMLAAMVVIFLAVSKALGGYDHANKVVFGRNPRLFIRPGGGAQLTVLVWFSYMALWFLCDPMFPQLFQRFLAAKNAKSLRFSAVVYPLLTGVLFFLPIATGVMGRAVFPKLYGTETDKILPKLVGELLPGWLGALAIAAGLTALMSTMDSQLLTLGSMFSRDVRDMVKPKRAKFLLNERLVVVVLALAGLALALRPWNTILEIATETFTGLAVLFPVTVAAIYWRRTNPWAAFASIVTGESLLVLYHFKLLPTFGFLPVIPVVLASSVVLGAGSLLFPARNLEAFEKVSNRGLGWAVAFGAVFLLSIDVWNWRQVVPFAFYLPGWFWHSVSLIAVLFMLILLYLRTRDRSAAEFFIRPEKRDLFRRLRHVGFKRYFYGGAYRPEPRDDEEPVSSPDAGDPE